MIINTPISLGELIDKISILQIKRSKIQNVEKQKKRSFKSEKEF